jgi:hypothetical protein
MPCVFLGSIIQSLISYASTACAWPYVNAQQVYSTCVHTGKIYAEACRESQRDRVFYQLVIHLLKLIRRELEERMTAMKKFVAILLLSGSLLMPLASFAEEHRYYDRDHRDWHPWNQNENRAYRHWLMEERRERQFREYRRLRAERQREYWRWRHEHSDWR